MIADTFENRKFYAGMHKDLARGFAAVEKCLRSLPDEDCRIEIDGLPVVVQHYTTREFAERKFEGHRKCIDIQYMVRGKETIYWSNTDGLSPCTEYSEERDHLSYSDGDAHSPLRLRGGEFAIFLPQDAHKTGCSWDQPSDVVKIIAKVAL